MCRSFQGRKETYPLSPLLAAKVTWEDVSFRLINVTIISFIYIQNSYSDLNEMIPMFKKENMVS